MFSSISPENTNHTPQVSPDDDFVAIETPQSEGPNQESGSKDEDMNFIAGNELPGEAHIKQVLGYFINHTSTASATDPRVSIALDTSIQLIERDHTIIRVDNPNGILSSYYPASIPYINGELSDQNIVFENPTTQQELNELVRRAFRARCRQRFPVSVIMYNGKTICRSATLSGCGEVYGRMALDMIRPGNVPPPTEGNVDTTIATPMVVGNEEWKVLAENHIADVALLKKLRVGTIVDLMVENRKFKLGLPVTSSEKITDDGKYHSNFVLLSMPFPGCEFFKEFHGQSYEPKGLHFDWTQPMCDAELTVPAYPALDHLNIDWSNYKQWDLVQMTQNYIKYIVKYLEDNDSGILIHCISGWDRTPLFISLLRMSLWADGVIHKSLETDELLYLTLAYDWMLFGHHLSDRLRKNEDILLYCFTVLKFLVDDEYSIRPNLNLQKTEGFPIFEDDESHYVEPPFSPSESLEPFKEDSNESTDYYSVSSAVLGSPPERGSPIPMEEDDNVRVLYDEARALEEADHDFHGEASTADPPTCAQGDETRASYGETGAHAQGDSSPVLYDEARALDEAPHGSDEGARALDEDVSAQGDGSRALYDEARALDDDARAPNFDSAHSAEASCRSRTSSRCGLESSSTGSWQMVSGTGSVRGSDSQSEVDTVSSHEGSQLATGDYPTSRKVKLAQIRRLFYRCYYHTLSHKHVNYVARSGVLSVIMSNLAEIAQVLGQPQKP